MEKKQSDQRKERKPNRKPEDTGNKKLDGPNRPST
ncbi:acid-soluble spore protein SspM [Virgibacillus siamensis]